MSRKGIRLYPYVRDGGRYKLGQDLVSTSTGSPIPPPPVTCHILTQFGQGILTQSLDFLTPNICAAAVTCRILTQSGDRITTQAGDFLDTTACGSTTPAVTFRILTESGDHLLTQSNDFLDPEH